jgi:CRISPR-associated protein Csd1
MAWMQKLSETYDALFGNEPTGAELLMPIDHTSQQAHVEIVIDSCGNFRRASVLTKVGTVIPATESSAGRTSGPVPHGLCDKLQYCAGDYADFGGKKEHCFDAYLQQLESWCNSEFWHPTARAVLSYVKKRQIVRDLANEKVLDVKDGVLVTAEDLDHDKPKRKGVSVPRAAIFAAVIQDQGDALVRWRVEADGNPSSGTWEDISLIQCWQRFNAAHGAVRGFCMVTGADSSTLAQQHPLRIRHPGDKAKLISSSNNAIYTFRGRFLKPEQCVTIGSEITQKAHNALRWLIGRQAYKNGEQVIVSWCVAGKPVPDPWQNSSALFAESDELVMERVDVTNASPIGDAGQSFATRLVRAIAGYRANLSDSDDIVVMAVDSATQGRMGIAFYRELKGSEFLERVESWHRNNAWFQRFGKDLSFVGVPAPKDIAESAYGHRLDERLRKSTVERLLPCIIDGAAIPRDLVESTVRRAANRVGVENWEWEKCLGIACALYRGFHGERKYEMSLEEDRNTRDYLYGRLLAVAEHLESRALFVAGEKRETMAARLMQRFADRPFSTWKTIELSLSPYKSRLRASRSGFLWGMEQLLDSLIGSFQTTNDRESFTNDRSLSGEFLLGYHCQRRTLNEKPERTDPVTESGVSELEIKESA